MSAPLIIIGTGLAGYNLVKEFRKHDQERAIVMLTSDDGRQYSKPMLSTGFSKGKDAAGLAMNDAGAMADTLKIEIRTFQKVSKIDAVQKQVFVQDDVLEYSDLVLALGAEPITLQMPGSEHLMHVNDLMDYHAFHQAVQSKKEIVVLGAGLVGCEYAHDLAAAGFNVQLVAPDAQPLSRLVPQACGEALIPALQALGVTLHLGLSASAVKKTAEGVEVTLSDGSVLSADVVLSAVGLRARTEIAKAAGLSVDKAIEVDRHLQTSDKNIYALGDCAQVDGLHLLYVLPLMNSARALAKTLAGQENLLQYPVMPVMVKTPSMPVVTCPPRDTSVGEWTIEGHTPHLQALFKDSDGKLHGYALTGDCVAEKMKLNKELSVSWL
jgi:rubredoxin-NAD+ reductase